MKLYELLSKDGFHTSIVMSFGIDFDAYENVMLSRFRGAGCHNNLLIVDGGMLGYALDGASAIPQHAGKTYTVTGARARGAAVFHPKIILQFGRKTGRMIISSANVSAAGLAGNLEVAAMIECDGSGSAETALLAAAWEFAERFLDPDDRGIRHQVGFMKSRTPWLRDASPASGIVKLADGTAARFIGSGAAEGIAQRFIESIGTEPIKRLVIVSPYWDEQLAAMLHLMRALNVSDTRLLIDPDTRSFPASAVTGLAGVQLHKFQRASRFIHAKIYIAQTETTDHALFGSANCTTAALGGSGFAGSNEEACLYRALPAGHALKSLDLDDVLQDAPVAPDALPPQSQGDDVPLAEINARWPGRFAFVSGVLRWSPPSPGTIFAKLELLGADGGALPQLPVLRSTEADGTMLFDIGRPPNSLTCARVTHSDGTVSAPGIILFFDDLRQEVRDARNKRIDNALAQLDGELEASLLLLDIINEIQDTEAAQRDENSGALRRKRAREQRPDATNSDSRLLTYEQFVAGRRLRSDASATRTSLGSSSLMSVRGHLNRLLSFADDDHSPEQDLSGALSMGDETDDADAALEGGETFAPTPSAANSQSADPQGEARLRRERRADNRDAIVEAVRATQEDVPLIAAERGLNAIDLLRLRALLMIIASAGWDGPVQPDNVFHVLPPAGDKDASWPRLMGKALQSFFGPNPAIRYLKIEDDHDDVPPDILEFWATCMWAAHAIGLACERHRESPTLSNSLKSIEQRIYQLAGLFPEDLQSERFTRMLEALSDKFSSRLLIDAGAVLERHRQRAIALKPAA